MFPRDGSAIYHVVDAQGTIEKVAIELSLGSEYSFMMVAAVEMWLGDAL